MKYNIRKNWLDSFGLMVKKPVVFLPFVIIAFLEGLTLELIYFSPRKPLADIVSPIVRKFFGLTFVHYPGNLLILPKLLYYAQSLIYIFIGALLAAITVNIVRNLRMNLPLKRDALIKNAFGRYMSLFMFGLITIAALFLVKKFDVFIFTKVVNALSNKLPVIFFKLSSFILTLGIFISDVILQTFLILTIPIIVIKKRVVFRALGESIILGLRNFFSIFSLIFLPFLVILPIALLKTGTTKLMEITCPEISLYIEALGIALVALVECFIVVCATQFVLDRKE